MLCSCMWVSENSVQRTTPKSYKSELLRLGIKHIFTVAEDCSTGTALESKEYVIEIRENSNGVLPLTIPKSKPA